ncbi:MAG TPA: alpha/beta hydrolase-fold protein [Candidatus Aquilonibacter sp.]|nr:alpha/beta hydrolase-fold protein [Candidatus Aquilonibacter sp.]
MKTPYARLLGLRGNLLIDFVDSDALRGNPLGDPHERPVIVYTPPGYDVEGSRRYPVLYLLHGYTGNALGIVAGRAWETNAVQWIDRLIHERRMPPALLVVVDGFTRLGGSQYVNSIHNGDYATYVTRDVIGHVDATFRTIAREGGRAVLGKSSGGFGSLHLVMEYPGIFAAFASHSGDSYFRYASPPSFPDVQRTLERHHFEIGSFVEAFEKKHKRPQSDYVTMEMLGYSAAYSPRSATAFDVDLPFDLKSGELRDDVFARWLSFDPVERIPHRDAELRPLRLRYIDCGRRDEYGLDIGARLMAERMRELGLGVRHEEFDDDHRNVGYRYEISMPALADVLDREE